MGTFGIRLRSAREKRGLRLVDVAKETGVAVHILAALEYDDFASLPGDEESVRHVRIYAEHLELDPQTAIDEFTDALEASRPAPVVEDGPEAEADDEAGTGIRTLHPALLAVAGIVVVLLVIVVWQWLAGDDPLPATAPETIEREDPAAIEQEEPAVPEPVADDGTEEQAAVPAEPEQPPAGAAPSELTVIDHGIGADVVNHRLVGKRDRFAEGEQVSFWTRLQGGTAGERIRHVWLHEGRRMSSVPLTVGGWHWRTHSRKTMMPGSEGRWAVEARDETGRVLARSEFTCTATPPG
jgi:transcriptional regulator with XRE-family HTH domain